MDHCELLKKAGIDPTYMSTVNLYILNKFVSIQSALSFANLDLTAGEEWCHSHKAENLNQSLLEIELKEDIKRLKTEIERNNSEIADIYRLTLDHRERFKDSEKLVERRATLERNVESLQHKANETLPIDSEISLNGLIEKLELVEGYSKKS